MMGDFEFRVWDTEEKEMLYPADLDRKGVLIALSSEGDVLVNGERGEEDYMFITDRYIPMLFSGLFNDHVNIYDKDIIEDQNGDIRRVKYWNGCYWAERIYPKHSDKDLVLLSSVYVLSKVVGNKFENEEMWNGEK